MSVLGDERGRAGNASATDEIRGAVDNTKAAIRMGKQAAKTAKTLAKAAGRASVGDFAGAAVEVAKDKETMKTLLMVVLIAALIFSFIMISFLYALPTSIFESITDLYSNASELYDEIVYSNKNEVNWALNVLDCTTQLLRGAGTELSVFLEDLWGWIVEGSDTAEQSMDDGSELAIIAVEAAEKLSVIKKAVAANDKYLMRAVQIYEEIDAHRLEIRHYMASQFPDDGYALISVSQVGTIKHLGSDTYRNYSVSAPYGQAPTQVIERLSHIVTQLRSATTQERADELNAEIDSIIEEEFPMPGAGDTNNQDSLAVLSLLTAQQGGSLSDMKTSDFMKYLGYYDSDNFWDRNTSFDIGGAATGSVVDWKGTFKPQYLMEEIKHYQSERTFAEISGDADRITEMDGYIEALEGQGIAFIDLLVKLDYPTLDLSLSVPTITESDGVTYKTYDGGPEGGQIVVREWSVTSMIPNPAYPGPDADDTPSPSPSGPIDPGGAMILAAPAPSDGPDEIPAEIEVTNYYRSVTIYYRIVPRSVAEVASIVGLWNGPFGDGGPGIYEEEADVLPGGAADVDVDENGVN